MSDAVETYLRDLISRVDDVPLIGELAEVDIGTPRATASIARAALCWLVDGQPDVMAERLRAELADVDLFTRFRLAEASRDVAAAYPHEQVQRMVPLAELQRRRRELLGVTG